jgi:ApaG protein
MVAQVTQGIKVSVSARLLEDQSNPDLNHFLFAYRIKIENNSEYTVQLLRRKWNIFDSIGEKREVEGEGVVGRKPIIVPGEFYEYESACNLSSEIGSMDGNYLMMREIDMNTFEIKIPRFELIVPRRLN